jgi:hypothetical protein
MVREALAEDAAAEARFEEAEAAVLAEEALAGAGRGG